MPTSATLTLNKGTIVPADFTATIGAQAARLYATWCDGIAKRNAEYASLKALDASAAEQTYEKGCAAAGLGDEGSIKIVFKKGGKVLDTLGIERWDCWNISSNLGSMMSGLSGGLYSEMTVGVEKAFGVNDTQLGSPS